MTKKTLDELEVLMEYSKGSGCGIDPDQVMKLHQNVLKAQQRKHKEILTDRDSLVDAMRTFNKRLDYYNEHTNLHHTVGEQLITQNIQSGFLNIFGDLIDWKYKKYNCD